MKLLLTILLLFSTSAFAEKESVYERVMRTGEIRCGYFTWPPFLAKDPNTGEISGLSADYIRKIGDILDLKIKWTEEIGVGDYIAALNADRIDMMCMTLWPDAGRLKSSLLSKPIFYSGVYTGVRKEDVKKFSSFEDMNSPDVKVSVIEGDITETVAEKRFPYSTIVRHAAISDLSVHTQSLMTKKADILIQDLGIFQALKETGNETIIALKELGPIELFPEMIGIKKGEIEFKLLIDNTIDVITAEGFVNKALETSTSSSYPNILPYDLQRETR